MDGFLFSLILKFKIMPLFTGGLVTNVNHFNDLTRPGASLGTLFETLLFTPVLFLPLLFLEGLALTLFIVTLIAHLQYGPFLSQEKRP